MVEAARLAIDTANKRAADNARLEHEWLNRTFQTEASVFSRPAGYNHATEEIWGVWGIHSFVREPVRVTEAGHTSYPEFIGSELTTKTVALFLEFGFLARNGERMVFPWLYPAWDKEKKTVLPLMKVFYDSLPSNFRYRIPGQFLSLRQVFGPGH
jgi:hypothetical protein